MKITKISPFTQKWNTMELNITSEQLIRWKNGALIQNVMPELTPDEREFLISGSWPGEFERFLDIPTPN